MFRRGLFPLNLSSFTSFWICTILTVGECGRYEAPRGSDVVFPYRRVPTIRELIEDAGYRYDRYSVITEDNHILALHRISPTKDDGLERGVPVLMVMGFGFDSDGWFLLGNASLPFVLTETGYDVWLGDYRGSVRSLGHANYSADDFRSYNYSIHELGVYDLPAFIDTVLEMTGKQKVLYVGMSLSAGMVFVMNSERPEYNDKLLAVALMAPLGHMVKFEDNDFLYKSNLFGGTHLANGAWRIGIWLFPRAELLPQAKQLLTLCASPVLSMPCRALLLYVIGFSDSFEPDALFYQISTGVTTVHINLARHLGHMIMLGRFCKFDFGFEKNLEVYGQAYPPNYELSRTTAPVFIIHGGRDMQVRPQAALRTSRELGNLSKRLFLPTFNHADFVIGTNAPKMAYSDIVDFFDGFALQRND